MKRMRLVLAVVLAVCLLCGCGPSAEDILEQYGAYTPADGDTNKAGLSISKVQRMGSSYMVSVYPSHPAMNQSTDNAAVLAGRLRAVDAQDPGTEVEHTLSTVDSLTTKPDGTSTQAYYPAVNISTDVKAKYVIIYFEGVEASEAPELATEPLFFIVELDDKEPRVLTETPLLAGDLF